LAFSECKSLSSLFIPSSVEKLGRECFIRCESLSTVTFESGSLLSNILDRAFCGCRSLLSICIPSSVTHLGGECFSRCESLSTVTIESRSKLSTVGTRQLFEGCRSLQSLFIPSRLSDLFHKYEGKGFRIEFTH
jgi:hypothetical protein